LCGAATGERLSSRMISKRQLQNCQASTYARQREWRCDPRSAARNSPSGEMRAKRWEVREVSVNLNPQAQTLTSTLQSLALFCTITARRVFSEIPRARRLHLEDWQHLCHMERGSKGLCSARLSSFLCALFPHAFAHESITYSTTSVILWPPYLPVPMIFRTPT
jgi:hypothetical protein